MSSRGTKIPPAWRHSPKKKNVFTYSEFKFPWPRVASGSSSASKVGRACIARPWRRSRGADVQSRGPGLSPGPPACAEGELRLKVPAASSARWAVSHTASPLPTHASLTWARASRRHFPHRPGLFALLQEGYHIRFGNGKTWT